MNILINRTDAIGDTILTIPMVTLIKQQMPSAKVYLLLSEKTDGLYNGYEGVEDIQVWHKNDSSWKKWGQLWKKLHDWKITHYFYVGGDHVPSLIALLSWVRFRGGLKSRWPSFFLLNKGVRQQRSKVEMHETEYNLNLLRPLGINYAISNKKELVGRPNLSDEERRQSFDDLKKAWNDSCQGPLSKFIVIHPGMNNNTLNWSVRNYVRLALQVEQNFPGEYGLIFSYTDSDRYCMSVIRNELTQSWNAPLKGRVLLWNGQTKGLKHYAALVSHCELFIGPSTGPFHLANSLGTKTLGIYSPIKVQSALRWGPFRHDMENQKVIVPDVVCGETYQCAGDKCPYFECMSKVEVKTVFSSVAKLLQK